MRRNIRRAFGLRSGRRRRRRRQLYLFERRQFGRVLNVPQAGALRRQLLRDALELWVLRRQDQAGVVAQLPQVLQSLPGWTRDSNHDLLPRILAQTPS